MGTSSWSGERLNHEVHEGDEETEEIQSRRPLFVLFVAFVTFVVEFSVTSRLTRLVASPEFRRRSPDS
jgi:hypothetical protein